MSEGPTGDLEKYCDTSEKLFSHLEASLQPDEPRETPRLQKLRRQTIYDGCTSDQFVRQVRKYGITDKQTQFMSCVLITA